MKKRYRCTLAFITVLLLTLITLHIALPGLIRDYLNKQLANMGDYRGHIRDIDLALWRGAYRINDLSIDKINGKVPAPLLSVPVIDLSVSWRALWEKHSVVAEVEFERPTLTFVDGDNTATSQTGEGVDWRTQLRGLLPITLNEVRVSDGTLAFRNFNATPAVNLQVTELNGQLLNLSTVSDESKPRPSQLSATAKAFGQSPVELKSDFNPLGELDDFDLQLRITAVQLRELNSFTRAYSSFDFNKGNGDLVLELKARQGQLKGYAKPILREVDIFDWQQDVANKNKSLLNGLWEAVVGGSSFVLKNQSKDQLASRIEIRGDLNAYDVSRWQAFKAVLRNAFVEAFNNQFDSNKP
ncbi:DUF748 domain-containing protein [Ectopseudomonas mendocina]|uniref:DUF748 domain-containing protein n=1 Tax=Ectopseudomonas mendocina TaxID=300 RepID=A0ABZ2RT11_ECTME